MIRVSGVRIRRIDRAAAAACDHAREAPVLPLGPHEDKLVVERDAHVADAIHGAAHRLSLKPDVPVPGAFYKHLKTRCKLDCVAGLARLRMLKECQGFGVCCGEVDSCHRQISILRLHV